MEDIYIYFLNAILVLFFCTIAFLWYITYRLVRIERSIIICSSVMISHEGINSLIGRLEEFGLD
jgi:hypothetical protein